MLTPNGEHVNDEMRFTDVRILCYYFKSKVARVWISSRRFSGGSSSVVPQSQSL